MNWSYSSLNSFHTCKRMFFLNYILCKDEEYKDDIEKRQNFFALYGTFAHNVFEKYNKGELQLFELYSYCKNNYELEIDIPAPPNKYVDLYKSYKDKLLNYFENFEGYEDKIVFSENEISYDIQLTAKKKISFHGFVDLLLEDKYGNYTICDYKSKSDFKNNEEYKQYLIQLLLYAEGIKELYGKYPKYLMFDMFKIDKIYKEKFLKKDLKKALDWVKNTIKEMYKEKDFSRMVEDTNNNFFCKYICSFGSELCQQIEWNGGEVICQTQDT